MAAFRLVLDDCYLANLGYSRPQYTWSNKRTYDIVTRVRLDRAVSTSTWSEHHWGVEVVVLVTRASDHIPLLVVFDKHEQDVRGGNRGFKFEDRWWLDSECGKIIEDAWDGTIMQVGQ